MRPTRGWLLALLALGTLAVGYLIVQQAYGDLPPLPRYAPTSLLLLALAEVITASAVRAHLSGRSTTRNWTALTVARAAVLAKASSVGGALAAGSYGALAVYTVGRWGQLDAARTDAVTSGLGVIAAMALIAAALWLEWSCRLPEPPSSPEPPRSTPGLPGQRRSSAG